MIRPTTPSRSSRYCRMIYFDEYQKLINKIYLVIRNWEEEKTKHQIDSYTYVKAKILSIQLWKYTFCELPIPET